MNQGQSIMPSRSDRICGRHFWHSCAKDPESPPGYYRAIFGATERLEPFCIDVRFDRDGDKTVIIAEKEYEDELFSARRTVDGATFDVKATCESVVAEISDGIVAAVRRWSQLTEEEFEKRFLRVDQC